MKHKSDDQTARSFHGDASLDGPQVLAPLGPGDTCPITWQPTALTPVFYGVRDLGPAEGAPVPLRLFFPSLDGAIWTAPILEGCGRYPVVVFNHGQCNDDSSEHYKQWFELPRRLAKSGYVVMVPRVSFDAIDSDNPPQLEVTSTLLRWIRESWEHRATVMPAPASAVIGHSRGGLLAGRFAASSPGIAAFASLGSGWEHEFPAIAPELGLVTAPKLLVSGNEDSFGGISQGFWNSLSQPKHRAIFSPFGHWDYLPEGTAKCRGQSSCSRLPGAAFDLVLLFLAKYMPPELAQDLPHRIPDSLTPTAPGSLTFDQQLFVSATWLTSIETMAQEAECQVALDWDTPNTRVVPSVRFLPAGLANQTVRAGDLHPHFIGQNTANSWVLTQSPAPGTRVGMGDTVTMRLRAGPIP